MASRSGTPYIGIANELEIRVRQHKVRKIESFAAKDHCVRLVYYESFANAQRALGCEKQLKGWRRSKKLALIGKVNPRWEDLAEKWGLEIRFAGQALP